jgi:hypothetical protein
MAVFAQKVNRGSVAAVSTRGLAKRPEAVVGRSDDLLELEAERGVSLALRGHETRDEAGLQPAGLPGAGLTRVGLTSAGAVVPATGVDRSAGLDAEGAARAAERGGEPLGAETRAFFEPRFGHSFASVRIHADGEAARAARGVRARAFTMGREIVFGAGEYRPGTPGGRRLLGHELAHVVQQSRAGNGARTGNRTIQRFDAGEHKAIGDAATEGRKVSLAPGLVVTYGDLVALGGDYFGDWETVVRLARVEGITEGTQGEIRYALTVKVRPSAEGSSKAAAEKAGMGKLFDEKAKAAVERRYNDLALHNIPHFPNPKKGDSARTQEEKDSGPEAIGAGASYRRSHGDAMTVAAAVGQSKAGSQLKKPKPVGITQTKDGLDGALLMEAVADHFLTDSFSAGHQQTERASIQEYWDAKYPQLWKNLKGFLADFVTIELRQHPKSTKTQVGRHLAEGFVAEHFAMPEVEAALSKIPPVGFGDIVTGAIHGYFNKYGALVDAGGKRIKLVGDSNLLDAAKGGKRAVSSKGQDTFDAAKAAVQAGIAEVYRAYEMGRQGEDPQWVPMKILKEGGGTLGAERRS